jgi:DNA-binding CsgD family transcriptional regulator
LGKIKFILVISNELVSIGITAIIKEFFPKAEIDDKISDFDLRQDNTFLLTDEVRTFPFGNCGYFLDKDAVRLIKSQKIKPLVGILLSDTKTEFKNALHKLIKLEPYHSDNFKDAFFLELENKEEVKPTDSLSARENEIISHLLKGVTSAEIAEILKISVETVKTHRKNINKKLKVSNVQELIIKLKGTNS